MHPVSIVEIICRCRKIDEIAEKIYANFSELEEADELAEFWARMSGEEAEHVKFWERAERIRGCSGLPKIFEDSNQVLLELDKTLSLSKDMLLQCDGQEGITDPFLLAFRMEFYLLHPAFEILFHLLGPTAGGSNPEDEYESHIFKFITMLKKSRNVSPELELLGETIQRLWNENKRLAHLSTRDELTGALNRRGFFSMSLQFAHLAQRSGSKLAVMMVDMDHFKSINDSLGHAVGDRVLKGTAELLTKRLRECDLIGRYGGEEFIVLLTDSDYPTTAGIAEELRMAIQDNPIDQIPLTASIGFAEAEFSQDVQKDFNLLISNADAALYRAKETGRNRVVGHEPETD